MALGTLDRSLPPFFNQGPSVYSKLVFFGALSLFLMVADARFNVTQPIRAVIATALYPVQWLAVQPVHAVQGASEYFTSLSQAQSESAEARKKLALQSLRAGQVEQLTQENNRLRKLLDLREQITTPVMAAEVLYDAADPYTRKVIIDKGQAHRRRSGFAGARRVRRARAGHARASAGQRSHAGDGPRAGHSGAQCAHRRAQRGLWRPDRGRQRHGAALHGQQCRRAAGRPADHQRRRWRLSARPAGGPGQPDRAPRRIGVFQDLLRARRR